MSDRVIVIVSDQAEGWSGLREGWHVHVKSPTSNFPMQVINEADCVVLDRHHPGGRALQVMCEAGSVPTITISSLDDVNKCRQQIIATMTELETTHKAKERQTTELALRELEFVED